MPAACAAAGCGGLVTGAVALPDAFRPVWTRTGQGPRVAYRARGGFSYRPAVYFPDRATLHVQRRIRLKDTGIRHIDAIRGLPRIDRRINTLRKTLTNVLRHAGPGAHVGITLRFGEDAVLIGVVDDGAGKLSGAQVDRGSGGNGLVGMRERVEVSGGRFTAGPRLGAGWQVDAELPTKKAPVKQLPVRTAG